LKKRIGDVICGINFFLITDKEILLKTTSQHFRGMPAVSLNQKNSGSMVEENLEVTFLSLISEIF
jgi:hypothetical protein